MAMFNDSNGKVREAIAWVFSRICENHADVIANKEVLDMLMPIFVNSLGDRPRVSLNTCKCIENLALLLGSTNPSLFSPYFDHTFKSLIQNSQRSDFDSSNDLMHSSFMALHQISEIAQPDVYGQIYELLHPLNNYIKQTIDPTKINDKKNMELQNYLSGVLQMFIIKIGDKLPKDYVLDIVNTLI